MKSTIRFLLLSLALVALAARAQNVLITATVTITNTAGTTNGQTITVNSDTRTWTNSVQVPAVQILTNNSIGGCATNLFNQASDSPFANLSLALSGTNGITLQTAPNGPLTVTLSPGWAIVAYTTNVLTSAWVVRMPISVELAGMQTNIASLLASALDLSTNSLSGTDVVMSNYVSLVNTQRVAGPKQFTNVAGIWSGAVSNAPIYNGTNFGQPFTSPGSGFQSEEFGAGASATALSATAFGNGAKATAIGATAYGQNAQALGSGAVALGQSSAATYPNSIALGVFASATLPGASAIGENAIANNTNSTAVGFNAITTADNQVMLGSGSVSTTVGSSLTVGTGAVIGNGVTNLLHTGTNTFPAGADVSFGRYAQTSLANGNNAGVQVGTNVFVEVSGPSGAFTINGINAQPNRDGKFVILLNRTGQNMTIAHDSGVDATPGNRIYCLTGADKTVTGNSAALLIYSASVTRWILLNFAQ